MHAARLCRYLAYLCCQTVQISTISILLNCVDRQHIYAARLCRYLAYPCCQTVCDQRCQLCTPSICVLLIPIESLSCPPGLRHSLHYGKHGEIFYFYLSHSNECTISNLLWIANLWTKIIHQSNQNDVFQVNGAPECSVNTARCFGAVNQRDTCLDRHGHGIFFH